MDVACPWGDEIVDLSNADLTAAEKNWLADEVSSGRSTAAILSKRFKIRRKTIFEWSRRVRKGVKLQDRQGRPRCLDNVSFEVITDLVTDFGMEEGLELKLNIRSESVATRKRRRGSELSSLPYIFL